MKNQKILLCGLAAHMLHNNKKVLSVLSESQNGERDPFKDISEEFIITNPYKDLDFNETIISSNYIPDNYSARRERRAKQRKQKRF